MKKLLQVFIGLVCGALGVLLYNYFYPISGIQKREQLEESQKEIEIKAFYQKLINGQFSDPIEGVQEIERLSLKFGEPPRLLDTTVWFPLNKDSLVLVPSSTEKASFYNFMVMAQVTTFGKMEDKNRDNCLERVSKYKQQQIEELNGVEQSQNPRAITNIEHEMENFVYLTNEGIPISKRINHYICQMSSDETSYNVFNLKVKYEKKFEELIAILERQLLENKIERNDSKPIAEGKAKNIIRLFFIKDIGNEEYEYRYLSALASSPDMQLLITTTILGHNCPMAEPLVNKHQQKLEKLHDVIDASGKNAFQLLKMDAK